MECTATAGRLGLGLLGLEGDTLGSSALLARDRDDQLFLGLGQRRVRAETARKMLDRLGFGDGRDFVVDGRRLLLVTSVAGKSLPNAKELTCGCLDAPVHNFRAYILSGIARGASSLSTKERTSASRALTVVLSMKDAGGACSRGTAPSLSFTLSGERRANILLGKIPHRRAVSSSMSARRDTLTSSDSNSCSS